MCNKIRDNKTDKSKKETVKNKIEEEMQTIIKETKWKEEVIKSEKKEEIQIFGKVTINSDEDNA